MKKKQEQKRQKFWNSPCRFRECYPAEIWESKRCSQVRKARLRRNRHAAGRCTCYIVTRDVGWNNSVKVLDNARNCVVETKEPVGKKSANRRCSLTGGQRFRVWDKAPQRQAKVLNRRPSVGRRCGLGSSNRSEQKVVR